MAAEDFEQNIRRFSYLCSLNLDFELGEADGFD